MNPDDIWSFDDLHAFNEHLEADIKAWTAAPNKPAARHLLKTIAAVVQRTVDMDPLGRSGNHLLPTVPMSRSRRRFLKQAVADGQIDRSSLLWEYCKINRVGGTTTRTRRRSASKPESTPAPALAPADDPLCCPQCGTRLAQKSVQTYRDPITDCWSTHRFWRCPACLWRAATQDGDSEWSHTPPVTRPSIGMAEEVSASIEGLLRARRVSKRRLAEQVSELRTLLALEADVDRALVGQAGPPRALLPSELALLVRVLPEQRSQLTQALLPHWEATLRAAEAAGWPGAGLRALLADHPSLLPANIASPGG